MAWSLLIKGGTVVDGSGAPSVAADVAVEGDRIAAIGSSLNGEAARVTMSFGQRSMAMMSVAKPMKNRFPSSASRIA